MQIVHSIGDNNVDLRTILKTFSARLADGEVATRSPMIQRNSRHAFHNCPSSLCFRVDSPPLLAVETFHVPGCLSSISRFVNTIYLPATERSFSVLHELHCRTKPDYRGYKRINSDSSCYKTNTA